VSNTTGLAPDATVQCREQLLDPARIREQFARRLRGGRLSAVTPVKAKYRVGHSLRVVYRVSVEGRSTLATARTFPDPTEREAVLARAHEAVVPTRLLPPVFAGANLEAVFWTFPNDRRLLGLDRLISPQTSPLRRLSRTSVRLELAGYTPEKCAVVACIGPGRIPLGYAKQYATPEASAAAAGVHTAITAVAGEQSSLRVPRVLGSDATRHVVLIQAARGRRLTELFTTDTLRAAQLLGATVARLHLLTVPSLLPEFRRATPSRLRRAAELIGAVRPRLTDKATALAEALGDCTLPDEDRVLLHGDLHLKNATFDGESVWLIDLDQAARGPAAADLGSFVALVRSQSVAGLMPRDTARAAEQSFLEGYRSVRVLPPKVDIDWHTAAALLGERGLRAVTRLRRAILPHLDALLDMSRSILEVGIR
jgi:tRNA A-37 threonylcarbamoyl transferase component Bud32